MKLYITLKFDGSGLEEMILEREANISKHELKAYLYEYIGISYHYKDKRIFRYCYLCDKSRCEVEFPLNHSYGAIFNYGTRPYCAYCSNLSPKERSVLKQKIERKEREKKKKKLLRLKEERIIREAEERTIKKIQLKDEMKLYRAEQELYRYEYFHEHGVYPQSSKSDNNIIYVWKHDDMYKIGITSKRIGKKRIWHVARKGNLRAEVLQYVEVENALAIEKILLDYGEPVDFERKFDGSTEFRYLSDVELEEITAIIQEYQIQY